MLRAQLDRSNEGLALKLEGQLVSAWAVQVKAHVSRHFVANGLLVDMSDVTYVDSTGELLLLWLRDLHARFVAGTCYARAICERLHLNDIGDADGSVPPVTEVHPPASTPHPRPGDLY
jgi:ABC-type transporter Mla MlaB component